MGCRKFCGSWILFLNLFVTIAFISRVSSRHRRSHYRYDLRRTTPNKYTKTVCMNMDDTLRARHRVCFLRPDTGPCRADILQWYYDIKQTKCFRFFWGGCQGNGNKFDSNQQCLDYCFMNSTYGATSTPNYCQLTFDYGTCFGHYNRWSWDKFAKTCKRRLYSGCGGNQNNFETQRECMRTCLAPPANGNQGNQDLTTCIPFNMNL